MFIIVGKNSSIGSIKYSLQILFRNAVDRCHPGRFKVAKRYCSMKDKWILFLANVRHERKTFERYQMSEAI